jgi:hypothetical protein
MTPARRHVSVLVLLAAAVLVACGSGGGSQVATGPSQTPGPPTTPASTPFVSATASASTTATATASAAPTPTATPTPDPSGDVVRVGQTLYPSSGAACGAQSGRYDGCPVTSRLASRLDGHPTPQAEPLCRCQNFWQHAQVSVTRTADPNTWLAHIVLDFGGPQPVKIDVAVIATPSGWLADDTTCTGQGPSTSIYVQNPPPC